MSTIADNFLKDGAFGRRVFALLASFYAIALLYGRAPSTEVPRAGFEVIAAVLSSISLNSVTDWLTGTLVTSLSTSPATPLAGALVLIASALSMAATFRRSTVNVSPQASFAYLLNLCVLVDLGQISARSAVIVTVVMGIVVGLFCLLPSDVRPPHPAMVACLMIIAPCAAILYGPAKVLNWLVSESPRQTVPVVLDAGMEPVRVEVVGSSAPPGARIG